MFDKMILFWRNEIQLTFRTWESWVSIFLFVLLVNLILFFGLQERVNPVSLKVFPWIATLLGSILRFNRTWELEEEGGILEALRLIPGSLSPFFLTKGIFNFIFILMLEIISFGVVIVLYNVREPLLWLWALAPSFILGGFGLTLIGTLFSRFLVSHNRRDLILPIISYPLMVPIILGVIKNGEGAWIKILIGFDVIYLVATLIIVDLMTRKSGL